MTLAEVQTVRVAVVEQRTDDVPEPVVVRGRHRRFGIRVVLVAVTVVAAAVTGLWWFRGGTFLSASGGGYGGVARPNEQLSVGTDLTTVTGPSVVLDSVSASNPDGAHLTWSVYRNRPGGLGFGAVRGPLGPEWPTMPVKRYRVSQRDGHPEQGATWLVTTVTASHPGVYRVSDITIKYHSARRARQSDAHTSICVLVPRPADEKRLTRQMETFTPHVTDLDTIDPLVAQFETCEDPTLLSS